MANKLFFRILLAMVLASGLSTSVLFAQLTSEQPPERYELLAYSSAAAKELPIKERIRNSCFLLSLQQMGCGVTSIHYGEKFGGYEDIFHVEDGPLSKSRGKDLGELKWSDVLAIPKLEPWPDMGPIENRKTSIGIPGNMLSSVRRNEDGRVPFDSLVRVTIKNADGTETPTEYNEHLEIKLGHIYLFRVLDAKYDHYALIRVEDLVPGTKVTISYRKLTTAEVENK
ncbi:MAG: hypothetical protein ABL999_17130 [Pyrinomonadaceae bacterium]